LVRSAVDRLHDAANPTLSLASRFDLAYGGAHGLALAALRFHGYRSQNRYTVFQALTHTVGLQNEHWRVLDQAHRKRNTAEYDGIFDADEALVSAVIRVATEVETRLTKLRAAP
jgi:hypothetical protein